MIKAVIFDLDGVLIDADRLHWEALNKALELHWGNDIIEWQEHLTIYKGIPTKDKLQILTARKNLPLELHEKIQRSKQEITAHFVRTSVYQNAEKMEMMRILKEKYKIIVCSNAIRATVDAMLSFSNLGFYVDFSLSNEDIYAPKPDPEIYIHAIDKAMLWPEQCLIVEDSDVGYKAAVASGAHVCKVDGPDQVNYYRVLKSIQDAEKVNVVIPAAGQGKRFAEVGYAYPKPLIPIDGIPMISFVLTNFWGVNKRNIVLMQQDHIDRYCVKDILKNLDDSVEIIPVHGFTRGAACTVLLAKELINNNNELIIANSDQFLSDSTTEIDAFLYAMRSLDANGGMLTFKSDNPKWSYAHCQYGTLVDQVAEKNPISENATVGIYYYKHGKDFVKYAEQMITKNIWVNNEFYVCPVFNEFIQDGKRIYIWPIDERVMHGLGTPEDLEAFLEWKKHENLL